jgi:hypothetical protein
MDTITKLEFARQAVGTAAVVFAYVTAVLVMALADVAMTVLLIKWSSKIRKASELPQPKVPLPELPPDHKVVVIGGGVKRWE